jgi:hypothetical protein
MSLTERWVRLYTAGLPEQVRRDRRAELASDVFEQLAAGGGRRAVVGRTVRGAVDDLIWRREVVRDMQSTGVRRVLTQAWWAPVAALVVVFDVALAVGVLADDGSTMPGRVVGPVLVLTAALALAVGLVVRVRGARAGAPHGARWAALAITAAAVLSVTLGGPVVLLASGLVVVAGLTVLVRGTVRSTATADGLVLVGTLPALAMFWLVVPAVLAVAVIVGVLTSRPRTAAAPA